MPTNEDKREVARRIRMGSPEWVGDHYEKWLGPTFGTIVLSGGGNDEIESAARHLAGLIDPEPERTCRNVSNNETGFTCSECGASVTGGKYSHSYVDKAGVRWYTTEDAPRWNRCPNCGARVVDE